MAENSLQSVAFPTLSESQMAELTRYAAAPLKRFPAGEVLVGCGDRDPKFFVIKSGQVEVFDPSGDQPRVIHVHEAGSFTGDVSHLTGNPSVVRLVAATEIEVVEISGVELR